MYSDADVEGAVAAGAISREAALALRAHVSAVQAAPLVDEEHFRLITGFNDVFVSIAAVLLLVAVGWLGQMVPIGMPDGPRPLGGFAVAATAWGLAEFFTRRRRMALPSILLLLAFVGGVFGGVAASLLPIVSGPAPAVDPGRVIVSLIVAAAAAVSAGAAWLHWRRFRVPITVAAGAAALVALILALLLSIVPAASDWLRLLGFAAGCAVFAFAMRWDMSDPTRQTRRSDVAFWLHLLAAPLIVHPVFSALAATDGAASIGLALAVLAIYVLLGLVALAIDRRALMVSALAYVLVAVGRLFDIAGAVSLRVALTALVIGSALLLLSAFWHAARIVVLGALPEAIRDRLPQVGRAVAMRPI